MTILAAFGLLAGVLSAACYLPYIQGILKGKVKPQRASWLIWSVLTAIAFFTQISIGASHSLWLPGVQTIGVIIVFLLSLKVGIGGFTKRDILTLIAAAAILVIWHFTNDPVLATYLTILIDGLGGLLTVLKSYEDPDSETAITWALSGTAGLCALVSVGSLNPELAAYPIYVCAINFAVVAAIMLGKKKRSASV